MISHNDFQRSLKIQGKTIRETRSRAHPERRAKKDADFNFRCIRWCNERKEKSQTKNFWEDIKKCLDGPPCQWVNQPVSRIERTRTLIGKKTERLLFNIFGNFLNSDYIIFKSNVIASHWINLLISFHFCMFCNGFKILKYLKVFFPMSPVIRRWPGNKSQFVGQEKERKEVENKKSGCTGHPHLISLSFSFEGKKRETFKIIVE